MICVGVNVFLLKFDHAGLYNIESSRVLNFENPL